MSSPLPGLSSVLATLFLVLRPEGWASGHHSTLCSCAAGGRRGKRRVGAPGREEAHRPQSYRCLPPLLLSPRIAWAGSKRTGGEKQTPGISSPLSKHQKTPPRSCIWSQDPSGGGGVEGWGWFTAGLVSFDSRALPQPACCVSSSEVSRGHFVCLPRI